MTPPLDVKILLVDDLEENLRALEAALRADGLTLLRAKSGREALELLLAHDVGLALLDVQMPEMDGFELAELMRGTTRTRLVPIIFLTAGAHDAQRMFRGYEVGAVDFLFKPIDHVLLRHKATTFVELHRQRLETERLASELREALRLTETFVAAVTHDLRVPLSSVIMGTSILDRALPESPARNTLARVRSSGDRMLGMLNQLYDLSRARLGGGIPIDPQEMDFRLLSDKIFEELRGAFPERALTVLLDDGAMIGTWDEARIGQVLTNLAGNALRYGTPGEEVRVRAHVDDVALVVEVHNGGEIPAGTREHIFDPFRRGSTERGRDGLGLGLYIVRQVVVAHGGKIDLTSSKDAGTTFRVELPRQSRISHAAQP